MFPTRMARLSSELQQEIATIIHQELKDNRLGFVTITRVELSKDTRHAKVFFSCLGDDAEIDLTQAALDNSTHYIKGLLKKRFRLRIIPNLVFKYDPTIQGAIDLQETLERLRPPQPEGGSSPDARKPS